MPVVDAYGRWLSDDGRLLWNGQAWQPIVPAVAPRRRSLVPLLLGIGGAFVALILLFGVCTYAMVNSPEFQRGYYNGYCKSYADRHPDQPCPLNSPR
jgi:hypothetical protein